MHDSRDYYKILKVKRNATIEEIKEAYRRLAREYHPDLHPGNSAAEERFREICEAYEILSDSVHRSQYDQGFDTSRGKRQKPGMSPQDFYVRAASKALDKNYQGAVEDYTQAIERNPNFVEAYLKRGAVRYKLGDDRGTLKDCTQALQLNSNFAPAYYYQGRARYRLGYTQAAIEAYTSAIRIAPDDAQAYYHRGLANHDLKEFALAIEDLQKATALFSEQGDRTNSQLAQDTLKMLHRTQGKPRISSGRHTLGAVKAVFGNALGAFMSFAINPTGGLLPAFANLDNYQASAVGTLFAVIGNFCFVTGISLGWGDLLLNNFSIYKLIVVGFMPFFSISMLSAIARAICRRNGSLAGDVFLAGAVLLPLNFLVLLSSISHVLPSNTLPVLAVFVSCYTILLLYSGCTQISNLSDQVAVLIVPVMLLVSGWLFYFALTTIQF